MVLRFSVIARRAQTVKTTMPQKQKFPHLLSSKWTARETTFGWRHFQVINRRNEDKWVFAEMMSTCDETVRFWINAKVLTDRRRWMAGWKTLEEIQAHDDREQARQTP
jgi:tryptophan-rich hypothetical protein